MGRSIRSKKMKANRARLRERYAPKELARLQKTVANLPLPEKTDMELEEEVIEEETVEAAEPSGDVEMGGAGAGGATISKSQLKKRLANKQKSKLRKKGIKVNTKTKPGQKKKKVFKF